MDSEAKRRLGLEWINAASRGVRSHLGVRLRDDLAVLLFDRPATGKTVAAVWDLEQGRAVTSVNLDFPLGMLFDWDWRAEQVEAAVERYRGVYCRTDETDPVADIASQIEFREVGWPQRL